MRGGYRLAVVRAVFAAATLALLALVVQGGTVPHLHDAPGVGLYNHDHDLTALATSSGAAPIPDAPGVPLALVLVAALLLIAPRPLKAPRSVADSRAPPVA
jgi:hypothetical protein